MHFLQKAAAALALVSLTSAAPAVKRDNGSGSSGPSDAVILNYALTLEHLEAAFYREGLQMYNAGAFEGAGFPEWVRLRFSEIANQEATHVSFLTSALQAAGATPVKECTYDFGIDSPATYLALSQVLEGVGVAAYLGAAPFIQNKDYLAVAGSILIVEAEHETWVRSAADNMDGFPRAFAAPLQFNQVYTLAAPFIKSCPSSNPALPVKAFPSFKVNTEGPYSSGQKISINVPSGAKYAAFVAAAGTTFQPVSEGTATIEIPSYATGQSYLILTNSKAIGDSATVAGPAIVYVPQEATLFDY